MVGQRCAGNDRAPEGALRAALTAPPIAQLHRPQSLSDVNAVRRGEPRTCPKFVYKFRTAQGVRVTDGAVTIGGRTIFVAGALTPRTAASCEFRPCLPASPSVDNCSCFVRAAHAARMSKLRKSSLTPGHQIRPITSMTYRRGDFTLELLAEERPVYFKPSFFPAASREIDSRMRLARVSGRLAV